MNKTQLKKVLKPQIDIIVNAERSMASFAWERGKALQDMTQIVNWRKTPYRSFNQFVDTELPIKHGTARVYIVQYNRMRKLGYTHKELLTMAKFLNYKQTMAYGDHLWMIGKPTRKMTVKSFIRNALAHVVKVEAASGTQHNQINIRLSDAHLHKLETLLEPHGYKKTTNRIRMNVSSAFEAWLDTL